MLPGPRRNGRDAGDAAEHLAIPIPGSCVATAIMSASSRSATCRHRWCRRRFDRGPSSDPSGSGGPHQQHGHGRPLERGIGHTTEDDPPESATTVGRHGDQVYVLLPSKGGDRRRWTPDHGTCGHRDADPPNSIEDVREVAPGVGELRPRSGDLAVYGAAAWTPRGSRSTTRTRTSSAPSCSASRPTGAESSRRVPTHRAVRESVEPGLRARGDRRRPGRSSRECVRRAQAGRPRCRRTSAQLPNGCGSIRSPDRPVGPGQRPGWRRPARSLRADTAGSPLRR